MIWPAALRASLAPAFCRAAIWAAVGSSTGLAVTAGSPGSVSVAGESVFFCRSRFSRIVASSTFLGVVFSAPLPQLTWRLIAMARNKGKRRMAVIPLVQGSGLVNILPRWEPHFTRVRYSKQQGVSAATPCRKEFDQGLQWAASVMPANT